MSLYFTILIIFEYNIEDAIKNAKNENAKIKFA
ncbi:MAG: hypothetical protein JWQ25_2200 [Daejeonella sp.]|nr:hypothetical protein [Daejeonella sp.]